MQAVRCNAVDHVLLVTADVVPLRFERCFDVRFEPVERLLVAAENLAVDRIVRHTDGEFLDIGHVDERGVLLLEVAGKETPLLEPLLRREVVGELDCEIEV